MGRAAAVMTRRRGPLRFADESGFTLIELVVASALSMVILFSVLSLLSSVTRVERATDAKHTVTLDLRQGMTEVTKALRQALDIDTTSDRSRLEMRTLVSGNEHLMVFDVLNGEFRVTDTTSGGSARVIARNVASAQPFCYDPPDCVAASPSSPSSVRITLAAAPEVQSSGPITFSTDVELRNIQ